MKMMFLIVAAYLALKIPCEVSVARAAREAGVAAATPINLSANERVSQSALVAALSGLRGLVADLLYIQAQVAWERTDWARLLLLFRETTTLQPHVPLFWDTAAWHMAWNASAAAANDPAEPRATWRVKRQREFTDLGRQFLEQGIRYNPNRPELYEALARLYRDKLHDHKAAADTFARAAQLPGAAAYDERFSAYELSYCDGFATEALQKLRALYARSERERLPTLLARLHALEQKLNVPPNERVAP